ncbi:hypothetical protein LMH73_029190 [Vibrio splendidus]|nr:hypothetical protein [Vibrio splendidus]MCC4881502.1 hypothetical protein [Vibrio splendidus]
MFNLIITIIAIAVFAAFFSAGAGYINPDVIRHMGDKTVIRTALVQYSSGVMNYNLINDFYPEVKEQFIPDFTSQPILPKYLAEHSYKVNRVTGSSEVCFIAEIDTKAKLSLLKSISGEEVATNFIISDSCGSQVESLPIEFPSQKRITYIIR